MTDFKPVGINVTYTSNDVYLFDASKQAIFDHKNALEINKSIPVELNKDFIIKLLPAQKILVTKTMKKDRDEKDPETGEITYDIETVEEEIDNPIVEAIILALPKYGAGHDAMVGQILDYVVGEHILVNPRSASQFYWFKDSYTISGFNILGRVKPSMVKSIDGTEATDEDDTRNISEMLDSMVESTGFSKVEDASYIPVEIEEISTISV